MLTFDPIEHKYFWFGAPIVSVTQALGLAGLIDSTWYTEFSRERGKAAHLATQLDDEDDLEEATVSPIIRPYLEASRKFKAETGFQPELIEHRVCLPECGYAGMLDRTGTVDKKLRVLLDYKTGAIPEWGRLQTAAYANAIPGGHGYTRFTVQLKPDGTYKIERNDAKDFRRDLNDFRSCLRVAQMIQERNGNTNGR